MCLWRNPESCAEISFKQQNRPAVAGLFFHYRNYLSSFAFLPVELEPELFLEFWEFLLVLFSCMDRYLLNFASRSVISQR